MTAAPAGHRAVVVEDDPSIAELVVESLARLGIATAVATTGEEGLRLVRETRPDLVTLDLVLPDMDGTEVCRRLREFSDAYVVMITGRADEADEVEGLEIGADDYLVKPFSPRELRARAAALLRRPRHGLAPAPQPVEGSGSSRVGVDPDTGQVLLDGTVLDLTTTERDLLAVLLRREGAEVTRAELVQDVHRGGFLEGDYAVDVQVAGLRRKLRGAAGADVLTAVSGEAYVLRLG